MSTTQQGEGTGTEQGRKKPTPPQLTREQRVAGGKKSAQKRAEQLRGATAAQSTLDALQDDVIEALAQKAKAGQAQAARELREWLRERGVRGDGEDLDSVPLEDMNPAQRAFALAYAERRIARAARRLQGMRKAAGLPAVEEEQAAAEGGTLPPDARDSGRGSVFGGSLHAQTETPNIDTPASEDSP